MTHNSHDEKIIIMSIYKNVLNTLNVVIIINNSLPLIKCWIISSRTLVIDYSRLHFLVNDSMVINIGYIPDVLKGQVNLMTGEPKSSQFCF